MFIGDKLRNNQDSIFTIIEENIENINDMYLDILALNLDEKENGEDSHIIICTILAICLINDIQEINYPFNYEKEDEGLISKVVESLLFYFTLQDMVKKKLVTKKMVNGEYVYISNEQKAK